MLVLALIGVATRPANAFQSMILTGLLAELSVSPSASPSPSPSPSPYILLEFRSPDLPNSGGIWDFGGSVADYVSTVTLHNSGNTSASALDYTLTNDGVSGAIKRFAKNAGATTCTATLAAGASCQLGVAFNAASSGSASGATYTGSITASYTGSGGTPTAILKGTIDNTCTAATMTWETDTGTPITTPWLLGTPAGTESVNMVITNTDGDATTGTLGFFAGAKLDHVNTGHAAPGGACSYNSALPAFLITSSTCDGVILAKGDSCTLTVTINPNSNVTSDTWYHMVVGFTACGGLNSMTRIFHGYR